MKKFAMIPYFTLKIKMLDLFIASLGDGFSQIIEYYTDIKANYFKLIRKLAREKDSKKYFALAQALFDTICAFTDKKLIDKKARFSENDASDKYWTSFRELFYNFFKFNDDFFYESADNVFSYFLARNLDYTQSSGNYTNWQNSEEFEAHLRSLEKAPGYTDSEWKENIEKQIRIFRPEYYSAFSDVRANKTGNQTFFKWPITEFKKAISSKETFENILEMVFKGKLGISKSFEKLLTEPGKRIWSTFEKLFSNEQNDKKLWKILNKDSKYLAAYQIFQSRMFAAYFLENLCAELPKIVEKENAKELLKILTFDDSRKRPEDFLIPNHIEKTKTMLEVFQKIWGTPDVSETNILKLMEEFDKDCPATNTFKAYFSIYHQALRRNLTEVQIKEAYELCDKNDIYFEGYEMYSYLDYIQ